MKKLNILYSTAMLIRLFVGYLLCSIGTVMMINSDLGLNPWGIFFKGLSMHT